MRKPFLPAFLILLMLFAFTACDDDDSDGSSSVDPSEAHYMTMSEMATITSILRLADDICGYDCVYVVDDDDSVICGYVDFDGDGEYDEGEQLIYYYEATNPINDDDNIYTYYENYSDDESGDSLYGTHRQPHL